MAKQFSILIVDDEPDILSILGDFFGKDKGYKTYTAKSGDEALEKILPVYSVDLIISDINMPGIKGFELLQKVSENYPHIKRVLITAYNIEDYLDMALKYGIGNIFSKTSPFNFGELESITDNMLSGTIFGVRNFLACPVNQRTFTISNSDKLKDNVSEIVSFIPTTIRKNRLELVLIELITNAIFYGVRNESPEAKENWHHDFELSADEAIRVECAYDDEKFIVSITDNGGKLSKHDVLYWLHRQIARNETGMPLGVEDSHGRGLFIARQYIDRLIINVEKGKRTEIIIINYFRKTYEGSKPLYINEI